MFTSQLRKRYTLYKKYITSFEEAERNSLILTQNGKAAAVLLRSFGFNTPLLAASCHPGYPVKLSTGPIRDPVKY
jgi:hypothetical protein